MKSEHDWKRRSFFEISGKYFCAGQRLLLTRLSFAKSTLVYLPIFSLIYLTFPSVLDFIKISYKSFSPRFRRIIQLFVFPFQIESQVKDR